MNKGISFRKLLVGLGILFLFSSCATYQNKVAGTRDLLKQGKYEEALPKLKGLAEKTGDDQLVYMMEYGTALQMAGRYKESNDIFLKADRLAEQVDYHSVSNITLATLGSEEMIQYKGESYEKLLINVSLALNYTMLGQFDDAMVEARRINEKINKIRLAGREDYEQNPFAHYLSGMLWEADRKFDDAYIAYESSYKVGGINPYLPEDLIRSAKKARREDTYKKWKKEFPDVKENPDWYDKNKGQVVVLIEQGWGPRKDFSHGDHRFPRLYPVSSLTQGVKASLSPADLSTNDPTPLQADSRVVYDVEQVAIRTLNADYSWMAARKIGAFAAKAVVADQIRQKNEVLGLIAWIGMYASDRADLRQWSTLPQTVQVARFWTKPGSYRLRLQGVTGGGASTGEPPQETVVQVKAGQTVFHFWRPTN